MESAQEVGWENMPGGKAVAVDLTKRVDVPNRAAKDQTGVSGPMSKTP